MDDLEPLRTGIARKDPWLARMRGHRDGRHRIVWVLVVATLLATALVAMRQYRDFALGFLSSLPAVYWIGSLIVVVCLVVPLLATGRHKQHRRRNRRRMLRFEESRYRR